MARVHIGFSLALSAGWLEVQNATDPQTDAAAAVVGRAVAAVGRAAAEGAAVPRAAAQHTTVAIIRTLRIYFRTALVVVLVVPVETPLPDVAVHVEQAK